MRDETDDETAQRRALAAVEPFLQRLLPAMLRRHFSWRRLPDGSRQDVLADLQQELHLDCLEHADALLLLPPRERHQRWFRLVERWLYRHRQRGEPGGDDADPTTASDLDLFEPSPQRLERLLPDLPQPLLEGLLRRTARHNNGRCNATATARLLGLKPRQVCAIWATAAERLGFDDDYLAFWRRRLAEAITGLAADLLLDRGLVHVLPRRRRPPDPRGRQRRIRRIHVALSVRPLPRELRRLLSCAVRIRRENDPVRLLALAAQLAPTDPAVALWQFEAAIVARDLPAAAAALRRARRCRSDRVATALARARLCEARGRPAAAQRALLRARRRQRDADGRLALALAAAGALPSTHASASPSSASAATSALGDDHAGTRSNQPSCR